MEILDVNCLDKKESRSMTDQQSDKYYDSSSPSSSISPFRNNNSKAYASAMRALQERIRFLESENAEIYESFRNSEKRYREQCRISEKLANDIESLKSSQVLNHSKLTGLKNDNCNLKLENSKLENIIKDLEDKIKDLSRENFSKHELDVTMRDILQRNPQEIEQLERIIANLEEQKLFLQDEIANSRTRADNEKELIKKKFLLEKQRFEEESKHLQDELFNEKLRTKEILSENLNLKNTLSKIEHKNYTEKYLKHQNIELQKQNEAYLNTIKDLEKQSNLLYEKTLSRSPVSKKSETRISFKTASFLNKNTKSRQSKSTSPSSPILSKPYNRHTGAHALDYTSPSEKLNHFKNNIDVLSKKYKKLISSSINGNNNLSELKQEIKKFSEELEAKTTKYKN